jgi:ribosomal protein L17
MLRNIAAGLFEHGQIVTTIPKAKAVQPFVEKIITKAKRGDLHARRQVIAKLGRDRRLRLALPPKNATDAEKEQVEQAPRVHRGLLRPARELAGRAQPLRRAAQGPKLVKHIFENVAPRFADRAGGYTRIVKLGRAASATPPSCASSSSSATRKARRSAASPAPAAAGRQAHRLRRQGPQGKGEAKADRVTSTQARSPSTPAPRRGASLSAIPPRIPNELSSSHDHARRPRTSSSPPPSPSFRRRRRRDALEAWRIAYLGPSGQLKRADGRIKDVPKDQKPAVGARLNEVKNALEGRLRRGQARRCAAPKASPSST